MNENLWHSTAWDFGLNSFLPQCCVYIDNSRHLAPKYARIFVSGHYLFQEATRLDFRRSLVSGLPSPRGGVRAPFSWTAAGKRAWEATSFPRAKLEENWELRGTDNVQGQISENNGQWTKRRSFHYGRQGDGVDNNDYEHQWCIKDAVYDDNSLTLGIIIRTAEEINSDSFFFSSSNASCVTRIAVLIVDIYNFMPISMKRHFSYIRTRCLSDITV